MLLPASATSSTSPSPHPMVVPRGWGSATSPAGAYPPLRPPRAHAPPPVTAIAAAVPAPFSSSSTPSLLWVGRWWSRPIMMGRETVLRRSLVCLGAAVCLVGLTTFSFKKMIATYVFGILAICGVVLPDWEFFDRDFSQWFSPMPADRPSAGAAAAPDAIRFKFYPLRASLFVVVYSLGLYKWWSFVSS